MLRTFVLDKNKKPLMPCSNVRARILLKKGKAKVFRFKPFTIILTEREGGNTQSIECKIDPGSKTTGIAIVSDFKQGKKVIFAINLQHRSRQIKQALDSRRASRRFRRFRKTRYRKPRFNNRKRSLKWLAPSLFSRVLNIKNWFSKLCKIISFTSIAVETTSFDIQKLQNPEISDLKYQKGELFGYEIKQYLLEKFKRSCVYCNIKNTPLEIDHIIPKSSGGTNKISNLALACRKCNIKKGNQQVEKFIKDKEKLKKLLTKAKSCFKDAAAVNSTKYAIGNILKAFNLPISFWSGGRTKYNRIKQNYKKDHWIDAACIGKTGENVYIAESMQPLNVVAQKRGSRQMQRVDRYGFPRGAAKTKKTVNGFRTGDFIKAVVTKGKKTGIYVGRVAIRKTGNFNIKISKKVMEGINVRYCQILQYADGYAYF